MAPPTVGCQGSATKGGLSSEWAIESTIPAYAPQLNYNDFLIYWPAAALQLRVAILAARSRFSLQPGISGDLRGFGIAINLRYHPGKHDRVTIGVAQPALPVLRPIVSTARPDDLCPQFDDTGDGGIEVVNFKPQEQPVPIRLVTWVTDRPVLVFHSEAVQLETFEDW